MAGEKIAKVKWKGCLSKRERVSVRKDLEEFMGFNLLAGAW